MIVRRVDVVSGSLPRGDRQLCSARALARDDREVRVDACRLRYAEHTAQQNLDVWPPKRTGETFR